jgi:predicted DNA-binding protein
MNKKKYEDRRGHSCSFMASDDLSARIDALAEKAGISKSRLLENMVSVSTDYLETMDSLGVIALKRVFDRMADCLVSSSSQKRVRA